MQAYVMDSVKCAVPLMTLYETYENKANISFAIKANLQGVMNQYGYAIIDALVIGRYYAIQPLSSSSPSPFPSLFPSLFPYLSLSHFE